MHFQKHLEHPGTTGRIAIQSLPILLETGRMPFTAYKMTAEIAWNYPNSSNVSVSHLIAIPRTSSTVSSNQASIQSWVPRFLLRLQSTFLSHSAKAACSLLPDHSPEELASNMENPSRCILLTRIESRRLLMHAHAQNIAKLS